MKDINLKDGHCKNHKQLSTVEMTRIGTSVRVRKLHCEFQRGTTNPLYNLT